MSFLLEYYPPFVQLINTEEYKKELMKFGINKNSKLIKISMDDAEKNDNDLILFRNHFPEWGSPEAEAKFTVPVKFGKKTVMEQKGVWIGWKKGSQFKVLKKNEAGGHDLKNLYDSDLAYKVTIDPKEILKKKFKEENPDYNIPVGDGKSVMSKGKLAQVKWKNKFIELADELIGISDKHIIKNLNNTILPYIISGNTGDVVIGRSTGKIDYTTKWKLDKILEWINIISKDTEMNQNDYERIYKELKEVSKRHEREMGL